MFLQAIMWPFMLAVLDHPGLGHKEVKNLVSGNFCNANSSRPTCKKTSCLPLQIPCQCIKSVILQYTYFNFLKALFLHFSKYPCEQAFFQARQCLHKLTFLVKSSNFLYCFVSGLFRGPKKSIQLQPSGVSHPDPYSPKEVRRQGKICYNCFALLIIIFQAYPKNLLDLICICLCP